MLFVRVHFQQLDTFCIKLTQISKLNIKCVPCSVKYEVTSCLQCALFGFETCIQIPQFDFNNLFSFYAYVDVILYKSLNMPLKYKMYGKYYTKSGHLDFITLWVCGCVIHMQHVQVGFVASRYLSLAHYRGHHT